MNSLRSIIRLQESTIMTTFFIVIIVCSSCLISNFFLEEFILPKWIAFGFGSSIILILTGFKFFKRKILLNSHDLYLAGIFFLILTILLFNTCQFSDVTNYSIFICFFVTCCLYKNIVDIQKIASISFICSAGISSVFAINQMFKDQDLTGCYDNLVGFDISLTLGILSIIYLLKLQSTKRIYKLTLCFTMLIFIILVILTKSRLAFLTIMIGYVSLFTHKKWSVIISSFTIICLISYCDSKKYESTYGRSFILKTSLTLLNSPNRILFGYGENGFKSNYMTRQSELLKTESEVVKQRASNIIHPLNEFLLMTIKYGILMPILSLSILMFVLFGNKKSPYTKSIAFVLLTYSFFSYPLRYPITWIAIATTLAVTLKNDPTNKKMSKLINIHPGLLLVTGCLLFVFISNSVYLNRNWKIAYTQSLLGKKEQSVSNYHILSQRIKSDEFIFNYASYLHNLDKNAEAYSILSNINLIDYETTMLSGKINASLGLYENALNDFSLAYDMCPNRFTPLFEIYKIYEKTNNKNEQKKYAKLIKDKQIKVPSPHIEFIINYVSKMQ